MGKRAGRTSNAKGAETPAPNGDGSSTKKSKGQRKGAASPALEVQSAPESHAEASQEEAAPSARAEEPSGAAPAGSVEAVVSAVHEGSDTSAAVTTGNAPPPESYTLGKVSLILTSVCNAKCKYCLYTKKKQHLDFEAIQHVVDQAKSLNVTNVTLTGGEPLLHPDFFRVVDYIHEEKRMYIGMITNAIRTDARKLEMLLCYPNLYIASSFDCVEKEINDHLRSRGAYDGFINMMRTIKRLQPQRQVGTITILSEATLPYYERTVEFLLENLGVDTVRVDRAVVYNNAEKHLEPHTRRFNLEFIERSQKLLEKYPNRVFPCITSHLPHCPMFNQGCFELNVYSDGTFVPCCFMHDLGLRLGSAQDDLREVLTTANVNQVRDRINRSFFRQYDKRLRKNGIFTCVECVEEFKRLRDSRALDDLYPELQRPSYVVHAERLRQVPASEKAALGKIPTGASTIPSPAAEARHKAVALASGEATKEAGARLEDAAKATVWPGAGSAGKATAQLEGEGMEKGAVPPGGASTREDATLSGGEADNKSAVFDAAPIAESGVEEIGRVVLERPVQGLRLWRVHPGASAVEPAEPTLAGEAPARDIRPGAPAGKANGLGWWLFPPCDIEATWRGGRSFDGRLLSSFGDEDIDEVAQLGLDIDYKSPRKIGFGSDGEGLLTLWTGLVARTPPGWVLAIRSPINVAPYSFVRVHEEILETDLAPRDIALKLRFLETGRTLILLSKKRSVWPPVAQLVLLPRALLEASWSLRASPLDDSAEEDARVLEMWQTVPGAMALERREDF